MFDSQQVIGCSGGGCGNSFNPHGVAASASASSSSSPSYGSAASSSINNNAGGGNCCNYYWQKPGHPCATHQGNDCPRSFNCVHFRQCVNGHMTSIFSGYTSDRPSLTEVLYDSISIINCALFCIRMIFNNCTIFRHTLANGIRTTLRQLRNGSLLQ